MRRRRNGKEASCEPCRLSKQRCDHSKPICNRCRRRAIQSRCYNHPAPLTRAPQTVVELQSNTLPPVDPDPLLTPISVSWNGSSNVTLAPNDEVQRSESNSIFSGSPPPSIDINIDTDVNVEQRLSAVVEVLQELHNLPLIHKLVERYYAVSRVSNIPAPLVVPGIPPIYGLMESHQLQHDGLAVRASLHTLAEAIISSTASPINITDSLTPQEFLSIHTGDSLRLEYLGIIYTIAGRASQSLLSKEDQGGSGWDFLQRMLRYSDVCLRVATEVAPGVTDAMIWLSLENTLLCTLAQGDAGEGVYRRLGDLSSYLFALDYNRDSSIAANAPFFLSESRRGVFHKAYNIDVLLSTRMGKPPRVLMKYSDTKLPLDLSDDDIVAEPVRRAVACSRLSPDGWSMEVLYCPSSFRRARSIAMNIREEVLQYEYRPMTLAKAAELEELALRSCNAWRSIPSHLKYTRDCWDSNLSSVLCVTLLVIYLGFLQSDFEIAKAMERADPKATASMVKYSYEMLTLVSGLGDARGRSVYIQHEFSSIIFSYGVPCAIVLTTAAKNLSRHVESPTMLPDGITRSSLIRSLSVFTSQLQNISSSQEANAEQCGRAAMAISRTLDELLNAPMILGPEVSPPADAMYDVPGALEFASLEEQDLDLESWIKSLEGTSTGLEWCTF